MFRIIFDYSVIMRMFFMVIVCTFTLAQIEPPDLTSDPDKAPFVYDDVQNFVSAFNQLDEGVDSLSILQSEYLDKATPGLEMFIQKYGLTAEMLLVAIQKHPDKYGELHRMPDLLHSYSDEGRKVYRELKEYIPNIQYPPTYFLIGGYRGIGSSSAEGSLITVESWSIPIQGRTTMLVHELVHFQQVMAIGYEKYVALYGPEKNLLGLCIREGVAEFFTDLILGDITQSKALEYTLTHEKRLWEQFREDMHGAETGDWIWTRPRDPEQPGFVGYALGYRLARSYYENANDKGQALEALLSVTDYPGFLQRSGYTQHIED